MGSQFGADLVLVGGTVVTVDPAFRLAEAVAIRGDRIIAVGANEEVNRLVGSGTRVIHLGARAVVPGLIDGHAHMDREGLKSIYPSLAGAHSIDDVLQRIEALVRDSDPGEWIVTMPIGEPPYYWDVPQNLREGRFPTRWELDRVSPRGIQIDKDFTTGEPTGIFIEWTFVPVVELSLMAAAPRFTQEDRLHGLRASMRAYNACGTTGVFEEQSVGGP